MSFSHPWRGIATLMLIIIVAPPIFVAVAAIMGHPPMGRQFLFELGELTRRRIVPQIMPGYSYYMPPAFIAAAWCAYHTARGRALTLGGLIGRMVAAGLICEAIYQLFVGLYGGHFRPDIIMVDFVQWIIAGFICWIIARWLGLAGSA